MKLIILGCSVTTEAKDDAECICVGFNLTTDEPGGSRYGATKTIPIGDAYLYDLPYDMICYRVLVDMTKLMYYLSKKVLPVDVEKQEGIEEKMRDLAIEGLTAFFSTGKSWSKNMYEVHDIKAGSMVMDVTECKQYVTEKDIRVVTKIMPTPTTTNLTN